MKKRYIFLILSMLCLLYMIPNGSCESGKVYLYNSQKIFIFSVETGDIIRYDYQTYDSPFQPNLHWVYQEEYNGGAIIISGTYSAGTHSLEESGWFEIEIMGGSDKNFRFGLMNLGGPGGYLEYNVRNLGEEVRIASAWLWGGIIVVIGVVSVTSIAFYFHRKKKKRKPVESPSSSSKNAL